MDQQYQILKEIVEKKLSYAGHDLDHVMRVYRLCLNLCQEEEADLEVLIPAVLLHDIARKTEDEDTTGRTDHAVLGAEMAGEILRDLDYPEDLIRKIQYCIAVHRFRSGRTPETIEAKILFDADKLDIIGAIGIARSYMLAGQHGERMHHEIPIEEYIQKNVGENGRIKDASLHTSNLEFELKLKKIPNRLFTAKAKAIARSRLEYMDAFFQLLRKEINGER